MACGLNLKSVNAYYHFARQIFFKKSDGFLTCEIIDIYDIIKEKRRQYGYQYHMRAGRK